MGSSDDQHAGKSVEPGIANGTERAVTKPISWDRLSEQDRNSDLYAIYCAIFDSRLPLARKCRVLTETMAGREQSWPVIGITPEALEAISQNAFKRLTKKHLAGPLTRAHLIPRIETAEKLFATKLSMEEFFQAFHDSDKTVLAIKGQNTKAGPKNYIEIDAKNSLFQCSSVGFRFVKAEKEFLQALHQKWQTGEVATVTRY